MPWVLRSLRTWGVGWAPLESHSRMRSSLRTIVEGCVCGLYWPIVSMKRPSRGERWSATTTRQIGFFLLPTRVRRSRTDIEPGEVSGGWRSPAARQLLQVGHLALRELAHQLLHLGELLDELPHRLHVGPGAMRDPPPAGAVDDLGVGALLGGHRLDDGLQAVELLVGDLEVPELGADSRDHLHQVRERAHLADLLELVEEVVEGELLLANLLLELLGLALFHLTLGL